MVTPADLLTLQQQLRQEVADVIKQLRAEMNEVISGRMDMLNSINTALTLRLRLPCRCRQHQLTSTLRQRQTYHAWHQLQLGTPRQRQGRSTLRQRQP